VRKGRGQLAASSATGNEGASLPPQRGFCRRRGGTAIAASLELGDFDVADFNMNFYNDPGRGGLRQRPVPEDDHLADGRSRAGRAGLVLALGALLLLGWRSGC